MASQTRKWFYNSRQWQQARDLALIRDGYLCRICGRPASDVHHIIHLTDSNIGNPAISLGLDNLICLCKDCHNSQHAKFYDVDAGYAFDETGQLIRL